MFDHSFPLPYFLGAPMWSNKAWVGSFFSRSAKPAQFLPQYASVLNTVEGNTTFYAVPKEETIAKWCDQAPGHFRFAFKIPREISHDLALQDCERELNTFLERLAPLGKRLGTFFLQMPPHFQRLDHLQKFLERFPKELPLAVEVRHMCFYDYGPGEGAFHDLLRDYERDLVIFDTHLLMALKSNDEDVRDAQRRKPSVPPRYLATGPTPFLRFCGDPKREANQAVLKDWAQVVASWITEGRKPYVFMHQVPDDEDSPQLCQLFHNLLQGYLPDIPDLKAFPCESDPPEEEQLGLF